MEELIELPPIGLTIRHQEAVATEDLTGVNLVGVEARS